MLPSRFFFLALFVIAAPVFAFVPGPELPLSTPAIEPAPFRRGLPRIASNGRNFLAVWNDESDIRAMRLGPDGHPIDKTAFRVAAGGQVAVASDGADYVVAYNCARSVCLAKVDADSSAVTAGAVIPNAVAPAIASNGETYLVAYVTPEPYGIGPTFMEAVEVRRDAREPSPPRRLGNTVYPAKAASNGRDYYVVWATYSSIETALVAATEVRGRRSMNTRVQYGPGAFTWDVASDGMDFMLLWQQNAGLDGNAYISTLKTARVSADGETGTLHTTEVAKLGWLPSIAWNGARYVVTFSALPSGIGAASLMERRDGDLFSLELTREGELVGPVVVVSDLPALDSSSSVASSGTVTIAVWQRPAPTEIVTQVYARVLGGGPPFVISRRAAWQQSIAAASAGGFNLFAWEEIVDDGQHRKVFLQRVTADGLALDGRGVALRESPLDQLEPAVGGSVVAWIERGPWPGHGVLFARLLGPDGLPRAGSLIEIGAAARDSRISIARANEEHLIVWQSPGDDIVAVRMSAAGSIDREPIAISSSAKRDWGAAVASDGLNFLVVWNRDEYSIPCVMYCEPAASVQSSFVTAGGISTPPIGIERARLDPSYPRIASNGEGYGAFWRGREDSFEYGNRQPNIRGRRLTRYGVPAGPVVTVSDDRYFGGAAWNGEEYVIATSQYDGAGGFRLRLLRLTRDLAAVGGPVVSHEHSPFSAFFTQQQYGAGNVALLFPGNGKPMVAYRKAEDGISRIVVRLIDEESRPRRRAVGR